MPELPDISIYIEALERKVLGQTLVGVRVRGPNLVRSWDPALQAAFGKRVCELRRLGKRIVFGFEGALFLVLHLMIAGRLRWRKPGVKIAGRGGLAAFDFAPGSLLLTEASSHKRASLHLVQGEAALAPFERGGLELFEATPSQFAATLTRENRTLKRALTDPRILSGVGNAYSDEILHRAGLSPLQRTRQLDQATLQRLFEACLEILTRFTEQLRAEVGDGFPDKVTAFREDMAVHGRYGKPCPECSSPVQRIRYASNECNYCPVCQTDGKLLKDRSLSRLLKGDWPRTLEELEELRGV